MKFWAVITTLIIFFWAFGKLLQYLKDRKLYKINEIYKIRCEWDAAKKEVEQLQNRLKEEKHGIEILAREKSQGFPWLARAYAELYEYLTLKEADRLEYKAHSAPKSAEKLREIARKRRVVEEKLRIAKGILDYYHELFPFLTDLMGEQEDEVLRKILTQKITEPIQDIDQIEIDPVTILLSYLSKDEYNKLTESQRNQLALDRYWSRSRKSKWLLGREYERYIGYLFEAEGYSVYYQGILEGFDDLGRDLVAKRDGNTFVVQCKRWSQHKEIHENHINQLFGTATKYYLDHREEVVSAVIYTTTTLSSRARDFAGHLSIQVRDQFPMADYPSIKCNISRKTGEKIYHLPFDQQYDKVLVEEEKSESYAWTVDEAESQGFRRAWRWRGTIPTP